MNSKKYFYITTPLYYATSSPHIGTAYTTILADVMTRFRKLFGSETFFMTGTDEHGSKVAEAAEKARLEPKAFADKIVENFKTAWSELNVDYNFFMRTTYDFHKEAVQKTLQTLLDKDEIYQSSYEGDYCTPCERFWTKKDLLEGNCPDCNRPTKKLKEKSYFFRMSKHQKALINHIKENPNFLVPESRRNEVLGFLNKPLYDLCISRPKERLKWGIELPFDKDYVTYVWVDALMNYITGVGYLTDEEKFLSCWPADYHLIGKDILTTHAVYWCTLLLAINVPLPKTILAHGWWLSKGDKMSKSKDNVITPLEYSKKYGVDVFRYFLLKDMSTGSDSNFTHQSFTKVVNSDLANDLGNLISRTTKMITNYFGGAIPSPDNLSDIEIKIKENGNMAVKKATELVLDDKINTALETIMDFVRSINKYIVEEEPWTLAKDEKLKTRLEAVLYTCAESIRLATEFMLPVMPEKCKEALSILGAEELEGDLLSWGALKGGSKIKETKGLFPRI